MNKREWVALEILEGIFMMILMIIACWAFVEGIRWTYGNIYFSWGEPCVTATETES